MSHEHDLGLAHDLSTLFNRRRALGLFGGAGVAAVLAACADTSGSSGGSSGGSEGVPLTMKLRVLNLDDGATPYAGAAVYLWHCDRDGSYSMYSQEIADENYLRGVQAADDDGYVTFTSIYPAAYSGRWPHIHFEVYPSLEAATSASGKLRTTQL